MMKTRIRNVAWGLLAAVMVAFLPGCVPPTGSSGGNSASGDEQADPTVPAVDDYTTLFESQGFVLPGTAGSDDAAIADGSVSVGDVDNDGDLDVVLAGKYFFNTGRFTRIYLNDGTGVFADSGVTLTAVGQEAATALGDVNGDGTLDLMIAGDYANGENTAKLYTNEIVNGEPVFTEDTGSSFATLGGGQARFFDADNDGDLDLLLAGLNDNDFRSYLYINQGPSSEGSFQVSTNGGVGPGNLTGNVWRGSVGIGDCDGEYGLDVVLTGDSLGGRGTTVLKNVAEEEGLGEILFVADPSAQLVGLSFWSSTSVGDVDGDGSLDLLLTGRDDNGVRRAILYSNDGDGSFTDATASDAPDLIGVQESASAFGDIDLDGDLDLLITGREEGSSSGFLRLYLNDGDGKFTLQDTRSSLFATLRGTIDLFDVDGDTDLDILVTGIRGANTPTAILHINTLFN